jgi:ribose 1,5-bisphosphokinase PhnN
MLVKIGPAGAQRDSILRDLRARLPAGWRAEVYAQTGIDAVITHVGR